MKLSLQLGVKTSYCQTLIVDEFNSWTPSEINKYITKTLDALNTTEKEESKFLSSHAKDFIQRARGSLFN